MTVVMMSIRSIIRAPQVFSSAVDWRS